MSLTLINGATRKKEEKILSLKSTLPAGNSFGERALMSNARRKATIIAHEHTYFACLERQYFNLTLSTSLIAANLLMKIRGKREEDSY